MVFTIIIIIIAAKQYNKSKTLAMYFLFFMFFLVGSLFFHFLSDEINKSIILCNCLFCLKVSLSQFSIKHLITHQKCSSKLNINKEKQKIPFHFSKKYSLNCVVLTFKIKLHVFEWKKESKSGNYRFSVSASNRNEKKNDLFQFVCYWRKLCTAVYEIYSHKIECRMYRGEGAARQNKYSINLLCVCMLFTNAHWWRFCSFFHYYYYVLCIVYCVCCNRY